MNIGDRLLEAWESMEVINYRNCKLAHKLPTNHLPGKKMAYFPKHQLPVFERYSVIDKLQEPKTSLIMLSPSIDLTNVLKAMPYPHNFDLISQSR